MNQKITEIIEHTKAIKRLNEELLKETGIWLCVSAEVHVYNGIEKLLPEMTNVNYSSSTHDGKPFALVSGYIDDMKVFQLADFDADGNPYYLEADEVEEDEQ